MEAVEVYQPGKKVFFVYPHKTILDDVVHSLVEHGYESYVLESHDHTAKICKHYKDSVVFLNIDQEIKKIAWDEYIRSLKNSEDFGNLDIGIMSDKELDAIITSFGDFSFNVAYICFTHGVEFCRQLILNILEKCNAKGKRKHVRVKCDNIYHASFSIKQSNRIVVGQVLDISAIGMACTFTDEVQLLTGSALSDLQLRLQGSILNISGKIAGIREDNGKPIYVVLFDTITDAITRHKLVAFITHMLQENVKPLLK